MYICNTTNNAAKITNLLIMKNNQKRSFLKGLENVKVKDVYKVRHELKEALNLTSDWGLQLRAKGKTPSSDQDIIIIENVFNKHGITEIWD